MAIIIFVEKTNTSINLRMGTVLIGIYFICTILTTTSIIFPESSRRKRGNPKVHENRNKVIRAYLNKGPEYNLYIYTMKLLLTYL